MGQNVNENKAMTKVRHCKKATSTLEADNSIAEFEERELGRTVLFTVNLQNKFQY